jgi:hypothetical protein
VTMPTGGDLVVVRINSERRVLGGHALLFHITVHSPQAPRFADVVCDKPSL